MVKNEEEIGGIKIIGEIDKKGIDFMVRRNEMENEVDKEEIDKKVLKSLGIDRSMDEDIKKMIVRKEVILERRDVEIEEEKRWK